MWTVMFCDITGVPLVCCPLLNQHYWHSILSSTLSYSFSLFSCTLVLCFQYAHYTSLRMLRKDISSRWWHFQPQRVWRVVVILLVHLTIVILSWIESPLQKKFIGGLCMIHGNGRLWKIQSFLPPPPNILGPPLEYSCKDFARPPRLIVSQ